MSWKKSKDGGLDFDTSADQKYEEAKRKMFEISYSASANTVVTLLNEAPLPVPPRNGAKERLATYRKRKYDR